MKRANAEIVLAGLLLAGVVGTGIALVTTKHESRIKFQELEALRSEHDRLQDDWSALQVEVSRLATHARIGSIAREDLGLIVPDAYWIHVEARP